MIISHKHRLIFFRSHKTGSTSLQFALSAICGIDDVVVPLDPFDEPLRYSAALGLPPQNFARENPRYSRRIESVKKVLKLKLHSNRNFWKNHMGPEQVRRKLGGERFESYRKFVVVRSPFETVISDYFWLRVRNGDRTNIPIWSSDDFQEFLYNDQLANALTRNERLLRSLESVSGVKFLRYEELPDALHSLCHEFSLPTEWVERFSQTRAKASIRPSDVDFSAVYRSNPSLVKRINYLFPQLIKKFGYVQSTPAQ